EGEGGEQRRDQKRGEEAEPGDVGRMRAGDLAALEPDAAAGRRQEVGQEIEAGRLAGAVGADERVDRAPAYPQPHALHREEAVKLLGEVLGLQDDVVGHLRRAGAAGRSGPRVSRATRGWPPPSPTTLRTRAAPSARPRAAREGRGGTSRGAAAWCGRWRSATRRAPCRPCPPPSPPDL